MFYLSAIFFFVFLVAICSQVVAARWLVKGRYFNLTFPFVGESSTPERQKANERNFKLTISNFTAKQIVSSFGGFGSGSKG